MTERHQCQEGGDRREEQPNGIVLSEEPEAEPGDDDGDTGDRAGIRETSYAALESREESPDARDVVDPLPGAQLASSVRISWNSVSPVRSIRLR